MNSFNAKVKTLPDGRNAKWAEDLSKPFPEDHADGRPAQKRALNISKYQGNANENHRELTPPSC